ncbi:MAG: glycosyltransferase [Gammaproteobacteria bacterium]|nr:glycosyltransferase [Gammaproteobacteria bacterium]
MAPKFSVIIPVYNGESTIKRAVESVLAQTWPAHEIIVVDDGSTDSTPSIVTAFGRGIRYFRQDNAGVSAARNCGSQQATGDWLAFLDSDDWYYPDRLRLHAEWIMSDPDLDFLTGDYDYVRPDGSRISGSMEKHASGRAMLIKAAGSDNVVMVEEELGIFIEEHFGDTHTLSVPRQRFLSLGGYPTGYRVCEDVFFLTKVCAVSKRVGVICRPLAAYLIHGSSATRRDPVQAQLDNVRTLVALITAAADYPPAIRHGVYARLRNARQDLGAALSRAGHRWSAIKAVMPTLWENSVMAGLRDVISMVRG